MKEIKQELLKYAKDLYREKLVAGTSGNISLYDRENEIMAITPSSTAYETMLEEDIVLMKLDGTVVEGSKKPSSEWKMHSVFYREREDINGVVHTHSPYATAFGVCQESIPVILIEMVYFLGGDVPVAKFGLPGSEEIGLEALQVMKERNSCLLSNHGTLSIGKNLEEAFEGAIYLEDAAKIYHMAKTGGDVKTIPSEVAALMKGKAILDEEEAKKYAVKTLGFFGEDEDLIAHEIGDGNLNNVFRVKSKNTGKSIILKQSLPYARTSPEMALDAGRGKLEALSLVEMGKHAPGMVPKVYRYDEKRNVIAMEDLGDYKILRDGMMEGVYYPNLGATAAEFFASTLISTSDIVKDSRDKKDEVKRFINKDLSKLTEDLVLTNSAFLAPRNKIAPETMEFAKEHIFTNARVAFEVAKLKHNFMNHPQALIHGDAHTGSVFVREGHLKFIDSEFAFYGPMGFDVGMFLGNLLMDAVYHEALGNMSYKNYVLESIEEFVDTFKIRFIEIWEEKAAEHFASSNHMYMEWYLDEVLKDIAGYCACEMIRRTTGSAHVKEMDDYEDRNILKRAQEKNLKTALTILFNQDSLKTGKDYIEVYMQERL